MNAREIIEAIDDPSGLIHPERHQSFASGEHPLGSNPAYPEHPQGGATANYPEEMASRQWTKLLDKARKYMPDVPLNRAGGQALGQAVMRAMGLIADAEEQHKEELEALALELVFTQHEFRHARAAYEQGQIKIDAQLSDDIDLGGTMTSDAPEAQAPLNQERTPAEKDWMGKMIQRRHLTNAMVHGSAVSNNYLFELGGAQLDRIAPGLRKAYGTFMVGTELGYWMMPQSAVIQAAKMQLGLGVAKVNFEDGEEEQGMPLDDPNQPPAQKVPKVTVRGSMFPVLIQEIIKGLAELASLPSLPRDPEERMEVIRKADLIDAEAWHMMLGPKIWDQFIEATDAANERDLALHLYNYIQQLDVDQFNGFMKEVLAKSPRGMQMLKQLAQRVRQDLGQGEDMGESIRRIVAMSIG